MKPACGWSAVLASLLIVPAVADEPKEERPALEMSRAVVCKRVEGYEKFVELPDASLTSEDKLNIYFRPLHFRVDPVAKPGPGRRFRASFSEDCRLRRAGEKVPFQKKDKLVEFESTFEQADQLLYMVSNLSLKGLSPGEYELDVVLHDVLEEGASATQTVKFKVVPVEKVDPSASVETPTKEGGTAEPATPPAPSPDKKKKPKVSGKPKT